jgi:hypothetical protein
MLLSHLIRTRLGKGPDFLRKTSAGILMLRRWVVQTFRRPDRPPAVLFIFGCQRSGTTLLSRIFEGDSLVCSFAEHSRALSRHDHLLRTRSLDDLEEVFSSCRGYLTVSKPLVESQRAVDFLDHFDDAKAIWSYRHYRDVVRSFVRLFDRAGVNIMKKIIDRDENWASERVSSDSRELVLRFFDADMPLNDAAAIFWLIRNALFFEQALDQNPRIMMCRYAELVSHADETMQRMYRFLDLPYPGGHLVGGVHEDSRGLGRTVALNPDIETLCEAMWNRLMAADSALARRAPSAASA